jgi:hypothetical protein
VRFCDLMNASSRESTASEVWKGKPQREPLVGGPAWHEDCRATLWLINLTYDKKNP